MQLWKSKLYFFRCLCIVCLQFIYEVVNNVTPHITNFQYFISMSITPSKLTRVLCVRLDDFTYEKIKDLSMRYHVTAGFLIRKVFDSYLSRLSKK